MNAIIDPRLAMRAKAEAGGRDPKQVESFLAKTEFDPATGCLNWQRALDADGYGRLKLAGKTQQAHRVAYAWFCEEITEDAPVVRHDCDNRACVSPGHLRDGTKADNTADMLERCRTMPPSVRLSADEKDLEAVDRNLVVMARTDQHPDVDFPDLASREGQDAVLERAARINAALVICDNFSTLAEVPDENEASAMNTVLSFLLRMKQSGRATILIHHSDKAEGDYRGSSKLAATFEVIIGLFRLPGRSITDGTGFELRWKKLRGKPGPSTRDQEMVLVEAEGAIRWDVKPSAKSEILALMDAAQSGQFTTQQQIADSLGWRKDKVTRMRNQAISRGIVTRQTWNAYLDGEGAEQDGPAEF